MRLTQRQIAALAMAAGLALMLPQARAHDAAKGEHGGPQVAVQDKHLELTVKGAEITVYVTDTKHEAIATTGATGKAVVQLEGKTSSHALSPGEGNRLVGKADAPIGKGARVVVSATLAGGANLQARFVAP